MTSAVRVADRIALLHDGRARFSGTPAEVKAATDPVLKGFVEGDPDLYYRDGWRREGMHAGGHDHGA